MEEWVLIVHEVADYPAWKAGFDAAEGKRRDAGERSYQLFHAEEDVRRVVHLSRWTSLQDARSFFESPSLVALRAELGVHDPEFSYLHRLESGDL